MAVRVVLACLVVVGAFGAAVRWLPDGAAETVRRYMPLTYLAAYVASAVYCWRIRGDHAPGPMRLAWTLLTVSSVFSVLRHGFEWTSLMAGWQQTMLTTIVSLRQVPVVLALVTLTAGFVCLWYSFAAAGMGPRFRRSDLLWLAGIAALAVPVVIERERMADSHSAYAAIRFLQAMSSILLAVPALLALVLLRISREMMGGHLAGTLRCMAAFLLIRLVSLRLGIDPAGHIPWVYTLRISASWLSPWLFLLACVIRWRMTTEARRLADRYEADPAGELARLRPVNDGPCADQSPGL